VVSYEDAKGNRWSSGHPTREDAEMHALGVVERALRGGDVLGLGFRVARERITFSIAGGEP